LRGDDVTVVTTRWDPHHVPEERVGGVRVLRFDSPRYLGDALLPWSPQLRGWLALEVDSFDIAHVHGHRSGLAWTARAALGRAGRPYVLQTHGTYPHHGQRHAAKAVFDRLAGNAITRDAALLLSLSHAEARDLPRPSRIVPNGIEIADAPAPRAKTGTRVLFVGGDRFHRKRADLLPGLLAALPGTRLVLVGAFSRPFREQLTGRADFEGVLDGAALAAAYASADVLVHPAHGEAFGLVPFEAALCGTPSVVAEGHGCGEWFSKAGGCAVAGDALVPAVKARIEDAALGMREVAAVRAFARRELTWARVADSMADAYRDALAGARQ
jgi:glycosyltransferase involved in cell wall biosynthesis